METVETVETVEAVETVDTVETAETVYSEDLKKSYSHIKTYSLTH